MSRGQPYVNLATDVLRAYFAALGGLEGAILAYVIEMTWGQSAKKGRRGRLWPDPEPCKLDAKSLMPLLGIKPTSSTYFYRAVRNLVESRMILKADGGYFPNKNAHEWMISDGSDPRLKANFLRFAASAQKLFVNSSVHTDQSSLVNNFVQKHDRKVNKVVHKIVTPVNNSVHKKEPGVNNSVHSAHYIERTAANPTGLIQITCPNGQGDAAHPVVSSSRKKRRRKKERNGVLPLTDRPIEVLPLVLVGRETLLHAHVMSITKTRDLPEGDPELADHVVRQFRDRINQGWDVAIVREAVNDTLNKVGARNPKRFESYLSGIFEKRAVERTAKPSAPPFSQRLAEPIPNVATGVSTAKLITAQDEAYRTSKGQWEQLPQSERSAIEAEFDKANPRPDGVPVSLWRATRKRGCIDLMASRRSNPSQPS